MASPPPCRPREQDQSPLGRWNVTHGFDSQESSPPATRTYGNSQHTSGAMDDSSRNVKNANAHSILRTKAGYRQQSVQRGDGRMSGKVQKADLSCSVLVHVRVNQRRFAFRGDGDATTLPEKNEDVSSSGALDESSRNLQNATAYSVLRKHITRQKVKISAGRWMKCHKMFKKRAHICRLVLVHV